MVSFYTLPPHHLSYAAGRAPLNTIEGYVSTFPESRPTGTRFVLHSRQLDGVPVTGDVLVTLRPSYDSTTTFSYPLFQPGDLVKLSGRLRPPPRLRNPADFDYGAFLHGRGLHATLNVMEPGSIALKGHHGSLKTKVLLPTRRYVENGLRQTIQRPSSRAILSALLLGDRSGLDEETRNQFGRTGLMHLLAVSGLHILLIGMIVYNALKPLLTRLGGRWERVELIRATVTLGLLGLYVLLVGAPASAVRAVVMAAVLIGGAVMGRSYNPLNALGVAALFLLAMRPTFLFDVGFQLSFAAVGGIVILMPRLEAATPDQWRTSWWGRQAFSLFAVSLAATLATAPIVVFHFGQLPLSGLLLNTLAIPLTTLGMSASLLAVLLHPVPGIGTTFGAAADALTVALIQVARYGSAWMDFALIHGYLRNGTTIAGTVLLLLALACWPRPRLRWRLLICSLLLWLAGGMQQWLRDKNLEVIFLDVGHGDAALITLPDGKSVLIDTGGRDIYTDQGLRTILPHLRRYNIRQLDAVAISHPHSDHLGGLPALLRNVPIGKVWHNGQEYDSALFREMRHLLDSLAVPSQEASAGALLLPGTPARLRVLYPDTEARKSGKANDASVVLQLHYGSTTFLFTGDAEAEAETRLTLAYDTLLASSVVKVAHHGSRTSSLPPFVEKTKAAISVVSVGTGTRYGLPDEEIITRWQDAGAEVHMTLEDGAVWLVSDGKQVRHKPWHKQPHWLRALRGDL